MELHDEHGIFLQRYLPYTLHAEEEMQPEPVTDEPVHMVPFSYVLFLKPLREDFLPK